MDIKELRQTVNMTQRQFANHFGIPLGTLRNWEQGIATPPEYVFAMILTDIRRDKMINVDTIKFFNMLNELAELTKGGFDDFSNATEDSWRTKIFYDRVNSNDDRLAIVLDACVIDDPKCYHHDVICYYDSSSNEFTANVIFSEYGGSPFIQIDLLLSQEQIVVEDGRWYFT